MFKERQTDSHFYDPFPKHVCDRYIEIISSIQNIPSRDPYLYAQKSLFTLGFWPNDKKEATEKKLSLLNSAVNLTSSEIRDMLSNKPNLINSKKIFIDSIKSTLDRESDLYGKLVPTNFKSLYEKISDGRLTDITSWEKALIYEVKAKYAKLNIYKIREILSSTEPIKIRSSLFEQLELTEALSKEFFDHPSILDSNVSFIDSFHPKKLSILTHALSESSLKRQIYLKSLGTFKNFSILSLSEGKIFGSAMDPLSKKQKDSWVLFFDPKVILDAGLIIVPNITRSAFLGENEVNILPPLDLSLCFAAVQFHNLKSLPGWKTETNLSHMVVVPNELLSKKKLINTFNSISN